ncbi:hexulose-6-phosphate synthase, partial [Salmonella enterica]|nr:hexulose-6-phosphate synthase [Salmonella enterica]EAT0935053.1 hexulose-6-phosphate synthase [Salmonella enterica]EHN0769589.1 hexulose-6-phosphate synthase [Salmonella enterica subsp. enterica serovar Heidelberg]EHN1276586.1 hexulose-6-phosphate synthase [Salmonella enterica]EJB7058865.1 hexulose-6-phosphate synthase [Salmonella enterica subsp. enterica serovar Heidelberg]
MLEFHNVPLKTILRRAIMSLPTNFNDILRFFEKDYDTAKEDNALSARGQFLQLYPLNHLKKMTLDDYVIGKGTAS